MAQLAVQGDDRLHLWVSNWTIYSKYRIGVTVKMFKKEIASELKNQQIMLFFPLFIAVS